MYGGGAENNRVFSVKSFYEKLLVREEAALPHRSIWIPKVPRKLCFFTWLATRGVMFTAEGALYVRAWVKTLTISFFIIE